MGHCCEDSFLAMSPGGDVVTELLKEFIRIYTQRPRWETLLRRNEKGIDNFGYLTHYIG
jgi:hypothetical protein